MDVAKELCWWQLEMTLEDPSWRRRSGRSEQLDIASKLVQKRATCSKERGGNKVRSGTGVRGTNGLRAAKAQTVLVDHCIYTRCNGNLLSRKR